MFRKKVFEKKKKKLTIAHKDVGEAVLNMALIVNIVSAGLRQPVSFNDRIFFRLSTYQK